jgi:hypothetical protein
MRGGKGGGKGGRKKKEGKEKEKDIHRRPKSFHSDISLASL